MNDENRSLLAEMDTAFGDTPEARASHDRARRNGDRIAWGIWFLRDCSGPIFFGVVLGCLILGAIS